MTQQQSDLRNRFMLPMAHVISWGIVFGFPFLMLSRSGYGINWQEYLRHGVIMPLAFLIVFYANYFVLIPRCLFKEQMGQYLLLNFLLVVTLSVGTHFWQEYICHIAPPPDYPAKPGGPPRWMFILRNACSLSFTIGVSAAIRLNSRWSQAEAARREAEQSRTEAELKNLRNQLNPHFLLNTLNNIYALIAFDADKAQQAVQELSRLLRHVLYDNQQDTVPLYKEMDFVRNYIELMRIRLTANVSLTTQFDVHPESRTGIAPLLFISLIENAFKHGISSTQPSFVYIRFSEVPGQVCCETRNSNHPKNTADKSGSGIGLEQVRRRLELLYPGRYKWQAGLNADGTEYTSKLTIYTNSAKPKSKSQ